MLDNVVIFDKTLKVKEGRFWVLRRFQQLRSYCDEIDTWNRKEIPYSIYKHLQGVFQLQKDQRQFPQHYTFI